jgi:hypothetical protein
MKCLSLRQPWAFAVTHLGKHLENRRWNTNFRGQFLIHASKGMTIDEYYDAYQFCRIALGGNFPQPFPQKTALHFGGIVGVATLVDVIRPCGGDCAHPWHMHEHFGFVLADVRSVPFVPLKGHLSFFDVPDEVARAACGS